MQPIYFRPFLRKNNSQNTPKANHEQVVPASSMEIRERVA
jgi:hypothetical protein